MKSSFSSRFVVILVSVLTFVVTISVFSALAQQELQSVISDQSSIEPQPADGPMSTANVVPDGPDPFFPAPTCWAGLAQLDRMGNPETFRAALQQAILSDDFLLTAYLRERLAELIGADPNVARTVITLAESAQGQELMVLPEAVQRSGAVLQPAAVEQLLSTAETHTDPQHRVAALQALKAQPSLNAAQLDRLTALGKTAAPVASQAILALGHVMRRDHERTEEYMGRLLDIAQTQTDPAVADIALEMGVDIGVSLEGPSVQKLTDLLLHHPAKYVRQMAGLVLTAGRDTDAVLNAFQQAFRQYDNFCFRWDMIRFSVTAAGAKALPLLKTLAELDPRFQPDYLEYKELYDSGTTDYVQVFWEKKNRHDECSVDEWAQP